MLIILCFLLIIILLLSSHKRVYAMPDQIGGSEKDIAKRIVDKMAKDPQWKDHFNPPPESPKPEYKSDRKKGTSKDWVVALLWVLLPLGSIGSCMAGQHTDNYYLFGVGVIGWIILVTIAKFHE